MEGKEVYTKETFDISIPDKETGLYLDNDLEGPLLRNSETQNLLLEELKTWPNKFYTYSRNHFVDHFNEDFEEMKSYLFAFVFFTTFSLLFVFSGYLYAINSIWYTQTYPTFNDDQALTLVLIGDSLIYKTCDQFNLQGFLYDHLAPAQVNIINEGQNSNKISDIANRLIPVLETYHPDALILFWDSDCSDVDEYSMTPEQVNITRTNYQANLTWVINTTLNYGTQYVLVGGPNLLGEGRLSLPWGWRHKGAMLDEYRTMNQNICQEMNVTYMDIRQTFQDKVPWYWMVYYSLLTVDGEHMNYEGSKIVAKLFGDQLKAVIPYNQSYFPTTNT